MSFFAPPEINAADPLKIEGVYELDRGCGQPDASGEPQFCYRDRLHLTYTGDGMYSFDVETTQVNGHACALEGAARRSGRNLVFEDGQCQLTFLLQKRGIELSDDFSCNNAACGARATLNGLYFPFSKRRRPQ